MYAYFDKQLTGVVQELYSSVPLIKNHLFQDVSRSFVVAIHDPQSGDVGIIVPEVLQVERFKVLFRNSSGVTRVFFKIAVQVQSQNMSLTRFDILANNKLQCRSDNKDDSLYAIITV